MMYGNNSFRRFLLILIAVLMVTILPNMHASALYRKCRSDPIFKLSNGDLINITLEINTTETNVRNVLYALHVPAGVTVTKVTYTAGGIGKKETYKVYPDSAPNSYTTDTVVTTQNTGSIAVVATTRLNAAFANSVSGFNGDHLVVTVVKR